MNRSLLHVSGKIGGLLLLFQSVSATTTTIAAAVANRPGAVARSEASSLGMQAVPSSIPTSGTFFRGDLVMKTFLRPFSLFR